MSRRPALRALLLAATPCLLGALLPCPAGAWGAAFTDRALEAALAELPFATAGLGAGGGSDGLPAEAMGELEVGAAAEQAVAALARALASGGRADVEPALACVVSLATDLWQPLASAGLLDPPGAAPGFFFRYEVVPGPSTSVLGRRRLEQLRWSLGKEARLIEIRRHFSC